MNRKKVGIAYTTAWHTRHVQHMAEKCRSYLTNVDVIERIVSGSLNCMGAQNLFDQGCDSVIVLGILLKGETHHFEAIVSAVSHGIMSSQLSEGKPIIYGVLTCHTQEQIDSRVFGDKSATKEWCKTAIGMMMN